jgi:site-specific DNA recombinase
MPSINGHGSKPERIALYLRVSSEEQREKETIEIQREFLEQYCQLYELEVAGMYEDDGISGTIPHYERPEGRRLLEDARKGKFDAVLVYKLDRLGRSLLVIVDAHDRLQEAGVALRSATEPIDTSTPSGRLIFQMLASFAEYERETIGERTRAGLHRAFRNGKHAGRIPYGYRLAPDETSLEVVEDEARIVCGIIANIAEGSTLYGESKRLNDKGIPSPGWRFKDGERKHGVAWSPSTIATIVHQTAYSGVHSVKVGENYIEREVPPLVESGLQERAEAALGANRHRASAQRKGARKYLLSGLVTCGICGYACTGHTSTRRGKKYPYYGCMSSNRPELGAQSAQPHKAPRMSAPWLEALIWSDVKTFVTNPGEVIERVREQLQDEHDTEDLSARLKDLEKRLAVKQGEKDRYVRLYAQGHILEGELETYLADLKNQTGNLRLLVEATEADLSQRRERVQAADTTVAWLNLVRERAEEIEEDTPEAFVKRQRLVRLLVEQITLHRGEGRKTTVVITYRFSPPDDRAEVEASVLSNGRNSEEFPKERKKH